jgi:hypothetical protein
MFNVLPIELWHDHVLPHLSLRGLACCLTTCKYLYEHRFDGDGVDLRARYILEQPRTTLALFFERLFLVAHIAPESIRQPSDGFVRLVATHFFVETAFLRRHIPLFLHQRELKGQVADAIATCLRERCGHDHLYRHNTTEVVTVHTAYDDERVCHFQVALNRWHPHGTGRMLSPQRAIIKTHDLHHPGYVPLAVSARTAVSSTAAFTLHGATNDPPTTTVGYGCSETRGFTSHDGLCDEHHEHRPEAQCHLCVQFIVHQTTKDQLRAANSLVQWWRKVMKL